MEHNLTFINSLNAGNKVGNFRYQFEFVTLLMHIRLVERLIKLISGLSKAPTLLNNLNKNLMFTAT